MMKKICLSLLLTMLFAVNVFSNTNDVNVPEVVVKNGVKYLKVSVVCDGIDQVCSEILNSNELNRIKAIAKLKSTRSWARLIESGNLSLVSVDYRNNGKVLTFILCHSDDYKLIDNSHGIELMYRKGV